jgi:hypothetical protein
MQSNERFVIGNIKCHIAMAKSPGELVRGDRELHQRGVASINAHFIGVIPCEPLMLKVRETPMCHATAQDNTVTSWKHEASAVGLPHSV